MKKFRLNNLTLVNKLIAILVTFCMIFAQYAIVGSNIVAAVAEELEGQKTISKGENVEFDAFFKNNDNSIHETKLNLEETQNLYIKVAVKDKVSVKNAVIKFEDANFIIRKDEVKDNRYISNIDTETNEIQIKNISSNNTALIELPIEFKKQNKINTNYFEKQVNITLKGNTEDINQHTKELEGNVTVKPLWTANAQLNITQSIEKYFSLGENGTLLQQTIESEINNNSLPRYKEVLQTEAPTIADEKPESVTVLIDGDKVNSNNVEYNNNDGIVKVHFDKIGDTQNNTEWGEAKKEYTIMYHYRNTNQVAEVPIKLNTKVESSLYTKEDNVTKEDSKEIVVTPVGNIATIKTILSGDIYKGYLYENEAKEVQYIERNDIDVSYTEGIENIQLQTNNNIYTNETGIGVISAQNITYKQTQVNKEELLNLLGQEGKITIKRATGEVIAEITKDTQEDEKGIITIGYPEGETGIVIETTKPQVEGKMTVLNTKAISGVINQPKVAISLIKQLTVNPEIITNISRERTNASIEVKETTTEATIEVSRTSLTTTQENQNIEIKATLNTNEAKQDLYTNPSLAIELPADVQSVNVNRIDKLYGDEFTDVKASQGIVDGRQVIRIDLTGEQKEHKDAGVKGTVLNINANVTLNKKATNKQDNIKMVYSNAKANQYKDAQPVGMTETPIEIISPKALITTNNIASLDIQTVGEQEGVTKTIERGTESKQFTVESEIINNNSAEIKDVKILGTFGTQGAAKIGKDTYENNINSMLSSELSIESVDMNKVRIYYTENEEATDDLEDINNRWQPTVANAGATKKYLVVVSKMDVAEQIKLNYNIVVPENLTYDKQMYQGYTVKYNDDQVISEHESKATTIELKTEKSPKIEANLTANIGGETLDSSAKIKRGEKVEYNIEIANTGDVDAENVKAVVKVPDGTTLLNFKEDYFGSYIESQEREVSFEIPQLKAGEKIIKTCFVKVNQNAEISSNISLTGNIEFNNSVVQTLENNLVVDESEGGIDVNFEYFQVGKSCKAGNSINIFVKVKNETESKINNVNVTLKIPEGFTIKSNGLITDFNNENKSETCTIEEIAEGETKIINVLIAVDEKLQAGYYPLTATVQYNNEDYRANVANVRVQDNKDLTISAECDKDGEIVNVGDFITYTIKMKNNRNMLKAGFEIKDKFPTYLMLREATLTDGTGSNANLEITYGQFSQSLTFAENEEKILTLKAEVVSIDKLTQDTNLVNKISVYQDGNVIYETKDFVNILKATEVESPSPSVPSTQEPSTQESTAPSTQEPSTQESTPPSTQEPSTQESTPPSTQEPSTQESTPPSTQNPEKIVRKISGYAWIDGDLNGAKDSNENTVPDIKVRLLDAKTNELLKDENGKVKETYTDDTGLYTFENIPVGQYIVIFEYDVTSYKLTEYMKEGTTEEVSSKAVSKTIDLDGEEKTYGVTEVITVAEESQISNINIGLVTTGKFDLQLNKYVSKITINNEDGIKTYSYDDESLAKVEIDRKKIDGTTVIIEYNIVVTNVGEISGYADTIEDEMPADLTFNSELNKEWTQIGSVLSTNSLENEAIAPGESKTLKLVLTKEMTESNTGIVTNNAEITKSYNEEGTEDINSTPGNGVQYENDYSTSDAILSIKTGSGKVYTTLILIIMIMIGASIIIIKKENIEVRKHSSKKI